MQLHRAILFVKDLPRMAAFYGETLGLRQIRETRTDSWMEFDAGSLRLALHAIPPHIAAQIAIPSLPKPREENPTKLVFAVEDLVAERKRLEALGITFMQRPWGGCDAIDPEGNVYGLCSVTIPASTAPQ